MSSDYRFLTHVKVYSAETRTTKDGKEYTRLSVGHPVGATQVGQVPNMKYDTIFVYNQNSVNMLKNIDKGDYVTCLAWLSQVGTYTDRNGVERPNESLAATHIEIANTPLDAGSARYHAYVQNEISRRAGNNSGYNNGAPAPAPAPAPTQTTPPVNNGAYNNGAYNNGAPAPTTPPANNSGFYNGAPAQMNPPANNRGFNNGAPAQTNPPANNRGFNNGAPAPTTPDGGWNNGTSPAFNNGIPDEEIPF